MKTYVSIKKVIFGVLLPIIAIGGDQLTKYILGFSATQGQPPIFSLISPPFTLIISFATIIIGLVIVRSLTKSKINNTLKNYLTITQIGVIAVLAGSISNLIDLVTKGYIVDIFNIAGLHFNIGDVYIITGSIIIIFTLVFRI